mmetsp:Transcript_95672/g.297867  ORF Transcript_95672/g.297867 Transcript_95672/m.297867 type:complete len:433 (-) Transcript_95672:3-1301(-)
MKPLAAAAAFLSFAAASASAPGRSFARPGWFRMPPTREVVRVRGWPSGALPLSFAVKAGGTVYASGLAGFDMSTMRLVPGGVAAETRRALQSLEEIMLAAGGSLHGVTGCNVLLKNMSRDFHSMNEAYAAFWPKDPPSRVAVEVGSLQGGASVEIQCFAAMPGYERSVVHVPGIPEMKGFPLSLGVQANDLVYASGMQGMDIPTKKLVEGGVAAETKKTLENIEAVLKAAGAGLDRAVSCEVSLQRMSDFQAMNAAYSSFWPHGSFPSRVSVQVAQLAGGAAVEIRCLAAGAALQREVVAVPGWPQLHGFPLSAGIAAGDVVYASGMQGLDMKAGTLVPGGVAEETRQALENVAAVFAAAGAWIQNALLCEVSLRDIEDARAMNDAYVRFWPEDPPARFCVQAAGLAGGAAVEIRCLGLRFHAPAAGVELVV